MGELRVGFATTAFRVTLAAHRIELVWAQGFIACVALRFG